MENKFKVGEEVVYEGQLCKVVSARQEWIYDLKVTNKDDVEICEEFYAIPEENVYEH